MIARQVLAVPSAPGEQSIPSARDLLCSISRAQSRFLRDQSPEGYWWYELESNVTITAEYLMLFRFLGIEDRDREQQMARYILDHQRQDGSWAIYHDGPPEVSTTTEAYFALKLAGISPHDLRMERAREVILERGGIEATRIFTRIFLALFGQYPWCRLPALPVEMILLPGWFPVSVYDFSSWARATLIPISVLLDHRPVVPLPPSLGVEELTGPGRRASSRPRPDHLSWEGFFLVLNSLLKGVERSGIRPFRPKALKRVEAWIVEHQEATGDWGGIQPAMVNAILALTCLGYPVDHPVIRKGLSALEGFELRGDGRLRLQSCISPVWDTPLTCIALLDSGLPQDHPALVRARRWLLDQQIFQGGDWQVKNPSLPPGGWAFEFANNWYPDVDDSAVVLMTLKRLWPDPDPESDERIRRGIRWVLGMRSRNGGWGAFDVNNDKAFLNRIPFADLEANLDPPTADLTGRVLELMGQFGRGVADPIARRAIAFLKEIQEPDGCWWGRWGVNYIYGTWSVLLGLASIGEDMQAPWIRKSVRWLKAHQNWDGGWGETCDSYARPELRGTGPSTPSQTAWAIMALLAAGEGGSGEASRGIQYLLAHQEEDGSWSEEAFTGTGFPKYFMIRYHNYRNCFPLMALGRYLAFVSGRPAAGR
jgi:squalene-hopene/tetraprenyl-beta-curcumene cyclase